MQEFDNPSAAAPFRDGYLLLVGQGTGKDSRHGLQLQYGVVESAGTLPKYSAFNFMDQTVNPPVQSSIVTPNGVYDHLVPYLVALDASTIVAVYAGEENGTSGLWAHVFWDDGATLNRVSAHQLAPDYQSNTPTQIGVSVLPGQSGFLVAYNSTTPGVAFLWCSLPDYTPGTLFNLNVEQLTPGSSGATGFASVTGDLSFVAIINTSGAGSGSECIGILVNNVSNNVSGQYEFVLYDIGVPSAGGTPSIASYSSFQEAAPNPKSVGPISLFRGPDGLAWFQVAQNPLNVGQISVDNEWLQDITTLDYDPSQPAVVYFTFDVFSGDLNPGDPPQTVNVYRTFLFAGSNGSVTQVGQAQRTAFAQDKPKDQQGIVVGIIASGPPVPNENIAGLLVPQTFGTTTFGETTSQATGWTVTASVGGFVQVKGNMNSGLYACNTNFKLTFGINSTFSRTSTSQQINSFNAVSSSITDNGQVVVNPQGAVLVSYCSYVGYMFQYLTMDGSPAPGTTPYYELYPIPNSMVFRQMLFDYPSSGAGIHPGQLASYKADVQQLEQNLLNGASVASFAWSGVANSSAATAAITQGTQTAGMSVNFQGSIGVTLGPPGNNVQITFGMTANFAYNYTWTTTTTDQLQSVVTLLAPNKPPPQGAFASYSYDVLLLAHNQQFTADLITLLNGNPTDLNKKLVAAIAPSSMPWMMVHALTAAERAGSGAA
jgi:hypothetical protein